MAVFTSYEEFTIKEMKKTFDINKSNITVKYVGQLMAFVEYMPNKEVLLKDEYGGIWQLKKLQNRKGSEKINAN